MILESNGGPWTEEQAIIIARKIRYIWENNLEIFDQFDAHDNPGAENAGFIYDPDQRLSIATCEKCDAWTTGKRRKEDLTFSERKALRLVFHDCTKYKDGTGGCDGCLNFDENKDENLGLEFSAGILEKLYTDVNFPAMPAEFGPNLASSPKELGI